MYYKYFILHWDVSSLSLDKYLKLGETMGDGIGNNKGLLETITNLSLGENKLSLP